VNISKSQASEPQPTSFQSDVLATTVVKFYNNTKVDDSNTVITKTLLKVGVVDSQWRKAINGAIEEPRDGEFWKVDVVRETNPGQPRGCFVLQPLAKVESEELSRLVPGMYTEELRGGVLYIYPKHKNINWILPLKLKQGMRDRCYAAIVVL
jgi:hypothetical protein